MPRNYQTEKEALKQPNEDRNWWKPTIGTHKIKIVTEPEPFEFPWKEKDGEEKIIKKEGMKIHINGEEYDWSVNQGITENSLWGQLLLVAAHNGFLKDQEITLIVKGSGKETSYTVLEALPLMTVKEEEVK